MTVAFMKWDGGKIGSIFYSCINLFQISIIKLGLNVTLRFQILSYRDNEAEKEANRRNKRKRTATTKNNRRSDGRHTQK